MASIDQTKTITKEICWGRGDTDPKSFIIQDEDGAIINISTWALKLTVNSERNPDDATNEQFSLVGVFVTDGADGQIAFTPGIGDTNISPSKYYYDIERTIGGLSVRTLIKGIARIIQDITKV